MIRILILVLCLLAAMARSASGQPGTIETGSLSYGRYGEVRWLRDRPDPEHFVVLLSGGDGPGSAEEAAARELAAHGALAVVVDTGRYLRAVEAEGGESCPNTSWELETLGKFVQKRLGQRRLTPPVLVGLGAGATLVYANLVQAPPRTFLGGVSLGFSPDLPLSFSLCDGRGLRWLVRDQGRTQHFLPVTKFELDWAVIQGQGDAFGPFRLAGFARDIPGAWRIVLPGVDRSLARPERWLPALGEAFDAVASGENPASPSQAREDLSDLPLIEIPARGAAHRVSGGTLAVLLSGDGGWAGLDKDVAADLADHGVGVVGWDSLRYFWTRREPGAMAEDLRRVLDRYLERWGASRVVLIGYSLGAGAMPFMASRLPADLRERVDLVALLAPEPTVDFEFQVGDWLGSPPEGGLPVRPELAALAGLRTACVHGLEETRSLCPELTPDEAEVVGLPGSHHFDGDYDALASLILSRLSEAKK